MWEQILPKDERPDSAFKRTSDFVSWLDNLSNKLSSFYLSKSTATGEHERWLAPEDVKIFGVCMSKLFSVFVPRVSSDEILIDLTGSDDRIPKSHVVQLAYDTQYPNSCCQFTWNQLSDIVDRDVFIFLHNKHFYPVIINSCVLKAYLETALDDIAEQVLLKIS